MELYNKAYELQLKVPDLIMKPNGPDLGRKRMLSVTCQIAFINFEEEIRDLVCLNAPYYSHLLEFSFSEYVLNYALILTILPS